MAIPDYLIVGELKDVENIYIVTKQLNIQDDCVYLVKYSGSSFLYPEQYHYIQLKKYLELKKVNEIQIKYIIYQLFNKSVRYNISISNMLASAVSFDIVENIFNYPKQLISVDSIPYSKSVLGIISEYIRCNKYFSIDKKIELQVFIETLAYTGTLNINIQDLESALLSPPQQSQNNNNSQVQEQLDATQEIEEEDEVPQKNSSPLRENIEEAIKEEKDIEIPENKQENKEEDEKTAKEREIKQSIENRKKILSFDEEDQPKIETVIEESQDNYKNSVIYKLLDSNTQIKPLSYDDSRITQLFNWATLYKKVGQHHLAKILFSYFIKLMEQTQLEQEQIFEKQEPVYVEIKVNIEEIEEWVSSLSKNLEIVEDILLFKVEQLSTEWHQERKRRVTASNFGAISKLNSIERKNKFIQDQLFPKFFGNDATRYGTDMESTARQKYLEIKSEENYEVREFGLMVSSDYPWIAGSPDGLVYQNGNKIGSIEIKCPYSMKDKSISDNVKDIYFLENKDNNIQLRKSHQYYSQCQGIMYLSHVNWCDFVVYTDVECKIIRVDFDKEYIKQLLISLNEFYFQHFLVELLHPCQSIHIQQQILDPQVFKSIQENSFLFKPKIDGDNGGNFQNNNNNNDIEGQNENKNDQEIVPQSQEIINHHDNNNNSINNEIPIQVENEIKGGDTPIQEDIVERQNEVESGDTMPLDEESEENADATQPL